MNPKHPTYLLNTLMTLSERLMLSYRRWKIHDINLAATCDDIQQVLFSLRSLAGACRGGMGSGGGGGGAVDGQTVDVIEDNVYHCQRAVYDFETRVLSMGGGNWDWNGEDLGSPVSIRWCPFDRAVHGALEYVIDELQLVISVAVDVFLLAGGGCQVPLREPVSRGNYSMSCAAADWWALEKKDGGWHCGNDHRDMFDCVYYEQRHRHPDSDSDHTGRSEDIPGNYCSAHHLQLQHTTHNRSGNQTAKNGPCLTKAELPHPFGDDDMSPPPLLQLNTKGASDFISTQVTDIDGWLEKVTNEDVEYDYYHAIIDEYYYPADHRRHSLPITMPGCVSNSSDEDSDSDSNSHGGSGSTASSSGECPNTSIILEYLDRPPRDVSCQKQCVEAGERLDDWCFDDDVASLIEG
ncbi:hypothetical protein EMPG_13840 [Blastomyces silverae]|uniref:Uncharacterized protein n=1 Tax=Blastomyces silverae TaxID=2060906 RepID=A0A0H1BIG2_9EURO|nr:hypothetical protein EMPG_13840 [Blastomyces silverae]